MNLRHISELKAICKRLWSERPRPLDSTADWIDRSALVKVLDGFGKIFIVCVVLAFVLDLSDRQSGRNATAWGLVTTKSEGNSGKVSALEYLNEEFCPFASIWKCEIWPLKKRESLAHINLSEKAHGAPVYLSGINLTDSNLNDASLSGSDLSRAVLVQAKLDNTKLCGTDLTGANLSNADLKGANLLGAILINVNLGGADLAGTDLRGITFLSKTKGGLEKIDSCEHLKQAKNWQLSYRSEGLACGKPFKADTSIKESLSTCDLIEIPSHLTRHID